MKRIGLFTLLALAVGLMAGCVKETTVTVNPAMVVGKWYDEAQPKVFWRFDSDSTGATWDESEDVREEEGTKFNWSTQGDQLRIDLYGEMGQHVYYDWTVTRQTADSLKFKDIYDNPCVFVRI